eukprot:CAMPEP_0116147758 /NCGR_PEP_ID=MMETSP0329-20121206/17942_1 /TAXON_ID=697910 /ORGANISM="Pseudo-nitzschia arenysensis, Strain B593" /LENGTH=44 /DNA_ID= /DNA_START= /DNA_END= /DNA_ORIENTATION=
MTGLRLANNVDIKSLSITIPDGKKVSISPPNGTNDSSRHFGKLS